MIHIISLVRIAGSLEAKLFEISREALAVAICRYFPGRRHTFSEVEVLIVLHIATGCVENGDRHAAHARWLSGD